VPLAAGYEVAHRADRNLHRYVCDSRIIWARSARTRDAR